MTTKVNGHATVAPPARKARAPRKAPLAQESLPVTEWDRLSAGGRAEIEQFIEVLKAMKQGDFSVRFESAKDGVLGRAGELLNDVIGLNEHMSGELVRVGKVVGQEGKMHERASVGPAKGSWAAGMGSVNQLIADLVAPTNEVARVITAVARGDLSQKMVLEIEGRPVRGEFLRIGTTVNSMVDQLNSFAAEVTRVAKEVGNEGKLGGQADVKGVSGTWKDLTDNVNGLAANLTAQVRNIANVTTAVAKGDLSQKITVDARGEILELKNTVNVMVDQLSSFAAEVTRVAKEVGTEGKLGGQADVKGVSGTWKDLTDNVNGLAANLTAQVRSIAKVTTAVANGDLSQKITVDARGEIYELKNTINTMVDTLRSFAAEVTRVAKEVGTEGRLGGQADVKGVSGTWKDLTDNVNAMASNLTVQLRDVSKVATAIANGDLTQKITVDVKGEILQIKDVINKMVDQLNSFAAEVTRVAKEVGTEGELGGQANVKGVSGTWKDLTDNVNGLASNLTVQLRDVSKVATAIADGDLTQKITVDVKGEILQIKDVINKMVDQLNSFAAEVTRVAKEVGTEGKLGGQAEVKGVSGTWKDLTNNVNGLAANLTTQVRNIANVTTAVANGDLSQKITVDAKGEILELKNTINVMVDQLRSFAAEVTRVAKEVGTEGRLGGQAEVRGVSGTWKDLTDNVNVLAANLTTQVRNIANVTTAVANGDLSQKITVDAKGEILELKNTINVMVDQLRSFAAEVTRVAKEVGTEGKLGGQADVKGVSGTWKDLTDNVNVLAANLTTQVRNIAKVTTAVARGDLSQKITVDARGEILELKSTINTMVDTLNSFAAEVTRVAKEVGTEGKLGGQADVKGVYGTWKDLTDNVNVLASNLTVQLRDVSKVATAIANGDLTQKVTVDVKGEILQIKDVINKMVDQLNSFAAEVTRVAKEVGTEGKLGGQAEVKGVSGTWKDLTDNVNIMASNLTKQVRGIVKVVTAVADGDLSQKFVLEAKGEVAALAETINDMTDTLRIFADQVTTVAREVGIEGALGGQANVPGASGVWKDLTDNVNVMASNLTKQVRGIVKVVTAVANGDLKQKFLLEAKGEVAALAETINNMTDTLRTFADQVTSVAREVGIEGKLGGQANVPGAQGTWRDLTDNVNQLAGNLTSQVRAIAEVSTAVAKGDLTRSIAVAAQGEVAALKDNINQMIGNLKDTTRQNQEQDWLKTNVAQFSGMMQGQRSIESVAQLIMSELTPLVDAQQGAFYMVEAEEAGTRLQLIASYGFGGRKTLSSSYRMKESLIGQCAFEKKRILLGEVPEGFVYIATGMGEAPPRSVIVLPVLFEGETKAVIELASFKQFSSNHLTFLDQLMASVGVILNMISSSMRTEELLQQLKTSNAELEAQAAELNDKAELLEVKNREVELASRSLEEKAEQLQLISEVQERVPREHVPRAADAAQQPPHPLEDAGGQPRREPHPRAGQVRPDRLHVRQRSPAADQRDPRPVQGRSRQDADRSSHLLARPGPRVSGADLPARRRPEGTVLRDPDGQAAPGECLQRHQPPAADPQEPAIERLQVHRLGRRHAHHPARRGRARRGRPGLCRTRHRDRDPRREAADDLRGVPAGRRHDEPQVRRHRPGPDHQPRDRSPARRGHRRGERARRGEHLHAPSARAIRRRRGALRGRRRRRLGVASGHPRAARRREARRTQGARRRRRRAQPVRPQVGARGARHRRPARGQRQGRARPAPGARRRRPRPDGYDDAGDGWPFRDEGHPGAGSLPLASHHLAHRQGHEG